MKLEMKILDERITRLDYATAGAAAVDLRACSIDGMVLGEDCHGITIAPGARVKIGTGVAIDLGSIAIDGDTMPVSSDSGREQFFGFHDYAALILPRSGLGSRGITLGNAPGLVDADFQGDLTLALWNAGPDEFKIAPLDRLAQLLIVPVARPRFVPVVAFSRTTERGANGFGSTGNQ